MPKYGRASPTEMPFGSWYELFHTDHIDFQEVDNEE